MDILTYFIIAGVVFLILEVTGILLAKQFLNDGHFETGTVMGFTVACLAASLIWIVSVPVGIIGGLLWLFSRLISEWLNK